MERMVPVLLSELPAVTRSQPKWVGDIVTQVAIDLSVCV